MRVCMLAYTYYELDNRVKRYAETLLKRGDHVDVVALKRNGQPEAETINGVQLYRIQNRVINETSKITYLYKLGLFLINSALFLAKKHMSKSYDLIHVHSIPDFEVFAALVPKLMGAKVILDIHDIVPELYTTKFKVGNDSVIFKLLVLVEKASGAFADHVIVANHIWHKTLISRSLPERKCSVIMNYPNSKLFTIQPTRRSDGIVNLLYPGTLSWHQGIDIAIRAIALIKDEIRNIQLHIYGDGHEKNNLLNLISELKLQRHVILHDLVSSEEMAHIMSECDIGIEPKRNDPFSGDAFSTKILEFMAIGIPVIASRTRVHCYYFNDEVLRFFPSDDVAGLADGILELVKNKEIRERYVENAKTFVEEFNWSKKANIYLDLVDSLVQQS
jgi:glycosyltransferase involved in cell wall biosynthesis